MKEEDYFRRAYRDTAFRQQKLEDLRYYRNVSLGVLIFVAVLAGGIAIWIGLDEGWRAVAQAAFAREYGGVWFPVIVHKRIRQCEAYYYIGMTYLLHGDLNSARGFLTKCVATHSMNDSQWMLAGAELSRLRH